MKATRHLSTAMALMTFLLLDQPQLMARAGGSHGGGGGSLIGYLITLPIVLLITWLTKRKIAQKKLESEAIIQQAAATDPIWDESKMEMRARQVFMAMQQAWMERDLNLVKGMITDFVRDAYAIQLDMMKANGEKNVLESIDVSEVSIISAEDYKDNSKDRFAAYIQGNMIDYTIEEASGTITDNGDKKRSPFADEYHFLRVGDVWMLDQIKNDAGLGDVRKAVNYQEA